MKSVEIAPGVLVVFYDDGFVEIASNYRLDEANKAFASRRGNVFMPVEVFRKLQARAIDPTQ